MIKTYKLIKEYPGSPKLGTEISTKSGFIVSNLKQINPLTYAEYWKEVIPKNYEVLSRTDDASREIYSIKRISDGVVFSIGDMIDCKNGLYKETGCEILYFTEVNDEIYVNKHFFNKKVKGIKDLVHFVKKPLFLTEDGVIKYHGDSYYLVNSISVKRLLCSIDIEYDNKNIRFSCKELAEEYLLKNISCLSLNDIEKAINLKEKTKNRLLELVKDKNKVNIK